MARKPGRHPKEASTNLVLPKPKRKLGGICAIPAGERMGRTNLNKGLRKKDKAAMFRDDLFWVYKEWGGKEKVLALIEDKKGEKSDKDKKEMQKHFIKSLILVYGKELDIKLKQLSVKGPGGEGGGKNFIFIMDGLDKKSGKVVVGNEANLPMQFLNQILNTEGMPEASPENKEEETEEDGEAA